MGYPVNHTLIDGELWLFKLGCKPEKYVRGDSFILPKGTQNQYFGLSSSSAELERWATPEEVLKKEVKVGKLVASKIMGERG